MTHQQTAAAALLAALTPAQRQRVHRLMQTTGASLELAVEAVQAAGDAPPHKHVRPGPGVTDLETPAPHSEG